MWRNGESRRISPIIGSDSGKAYRVDLRCVSGGSQSRKTQMEGVYFETGSRELYWCEIFPLHSALVEKAMGDSQWLVADSWQESLSTRTEILRWRSE